MFLQIIGAIYLVCLWTMHATEKSERRRKVEHWDLRHSRIYFRIVCKQATEGLLESFSLSFQLDIEFFDVKSLEWFDVVL